MTDRQYWEERIEGRTIQMQSVLLRATDLVEKLKKKREMAQSENTHTEINNNVTTDNNRKELKTNSEKIMNKKEKDDLSQTEIRLKTSNGEQPQTRKEINGKPDEQEQEEYTRPQLDRNSVEKRDGRKMSTISKRKIKKKKRKKKSRNDEKRLDVENEGVEEIQGELIKRNGKQPESGRINAFRGRKENEWLIKDPDPIKIERSNYYNKKESGMKTLIFLLAVLTLSKSQYIGITSLSNVTDCDQSTGQCAVKATIQADITMGQTTFTIQEVFQNNQQRYRINAGAANLYITGDVYFAVETMIWPATQSWCDSIINSKKPANWESSDICWGINYQTSHLPGVSQKTFNPRKEDNSCYTDLEFWNGEPTVGYCAVLQYEPHDVYVVITNWELASYEMGISLQGETGTTNGQTQLLSSSNPTVTMTFGSQEGREPAAATDDDVQVTIQSFNSELMKELQDMALILSMNGVSAVVKKSKVNGENEMDRRKYGHHQAGLALSDVISNADFEQHWIPQTARGSLKMSTDWNQETLNNIETQEINLFRSLGVTLDNSMTFTTVKKIDLGGGKYACAPNNGPCDSTTATVYVLGSPDTLVFPSQPSKGRPSLTYNTGAWNFRVKYTGGTYKDYLMKVDGTFWEIPQTFTKKIKVQDTTYTASTVITTKVTNMIDQMEEGSPQIWNVSLNATNSSILDVLISCRNCPTTGSRCNIQETNNPLTAAIVTIYPSNSTIPIVATQSLPRQIMVMCGTSRASFPITLSENAIQMWNESWTNIENQKLGIQPYACWTQGTCFPGVVFNLGKNNWYNWIPFVAVIGAILTAVKWGITTLWFVPLLYPWEWPSPLEKRKTPDEPRFLIGYGIIILIFIDLLWIFVIHTIAWIFVIWIMRGCCGWSQKRAEARVYYGKIPMEIKRTEQEEVYVNMANYRQDHEDQPF